MTTKKKKGSYHWTNWPWWNHQPLLTTLHPLPSALLALPMTRLRYAHAQLVGLELTQSKTSPNQPPNQPIEPSKSNPAKKTYPLSKFHPLTSAISQLCDGEIGILVGFEAVRKQLGSREDVRKLGW